MGGIIKMHRIVKVDSLAIHDKQFTGIGTDGKAYTVFPMYGKEGVPYVQVLKEENGKYFIRGITYASESGELSLNERKKMEILNRSRLKGKKVEFVFVKKMNFDGKVVHGEQLTKENGGKINEQSSSCNGRRRKDF